MPRLTGKEAVAERSETANSDQGAEDDSAEFADDGPAKIQRNGIGRCDDVGGQGDKVGAIGQDEQDKHDRHARMQRSRKMFVRIPHFASDELDDQGVDPRSEPCS